MLPPSLCEMGPPCKAPQGELREHGSFRVPAARRRFRVLTRGMRPSNVEFTELERMHGGVAELASRAEQGLIRGNAALGYRRFGSSDVNTARVGAIGSLRAQFPAEVPSDTRRNLVPAMRDPLIDLRSGKEDLDPKRRESAIGHALSNTCNAACGIKHELAKHSVESTRFGPNLDNPGQIRGKQQIQIWRTSGQLFPSPIKLGATSAKVGARLTNVGATLTAIVQLRPRLARI